VQSSLRDLGITTAQIELIGVGAKGARKGRSDEVWSKDRRVEIIAVRK
jgi:outer membrane protein OmpA-like peptidoglycan-associated protein